MIDLSGEDNEWLAIELRMCRAILGISQSDLGELVEMSLQSIKRLEKKNARPRYETVMKLRKAIRDMGVDCRFDETGGLVRCVFDEELIAAVNAGNEEVHVSAKKTELLPEVNTLY